MYSCLTSIQRKLCRAELMMRFCVPRARVPYALCYRYPTVLLTQWRLSNYYYFEILFSCIILFEWKLSSFHILLPVARNRFTSTEINCLFLQPSFVRVQKHFSRLTANLCAKPYKTCVECKKRNSSNLISLHWRRKPSAGTKPQMRFSLETWTSSSRIGFPEIQ